MDSGMVSGHGCLVVDRDRVRAEFPGLSMNQLMSTPRRALNRLVPLLSLASVLVAGPCGAAQTIEVQVEHDDDAYHIYFEVLIDAPVGRVQEIMTDYSNLHNLSATIVKSEIFSGAAGGDATVDIVLKPCVWRLCKTIRKVSTARINAYSAIVYTVIPAQSDFESGKEQVIVKKAQLPGRTRVTYNASLVPKFFVPPLIGSWLIRRHVKQSVEDSSRRVEKLAQQ